MTREGIEIDVSGLTKRFGAVHAVTDMTFRVRPGRVTGHVPAADD
ncbi:MAG: hypothetical protein ACRDQF_06720 [Thermocrispum sp.]